MNIAVAGLWHLGSVTSACMAASGHQVVGFDPDKAVIAQLNDGIPPVFEPGLSELVQREVNRGHLRFTADVAAISDSEVVWVTYDTPVDDHDIADEEHVIDRIIDLFPHLRDGAMLLVSSQLPVGTVDSLSDQFALRHPDRRVAFACSPENIRLGSALAAFRNAERVVIGIANENDKKVLSRLFSFVNRIEWMPTRSAEMVKHALNAYLATSIAFTNEVAVLCERTGADARDVTRGLKSDPRVGSKAYVAAGAAFAGGTLARDVQYLAKIGTQHGHRVRLIESVYDSNEEHKQWAIGILRDELQPLRGKHVVVWGLTYKPGTDTLRGSASIELCSRLIDEGARVSAHDPRVTHLPPELVDRIHMLSSPLELINELDAIVLSTESPEYREIDFGRLGELPNPPLIVDPNGFIEQQCFPFVQPKYVRVGRRGDNGRRP